jgi:glycerol dehydrogenase-like iron-containing ADH family enzyme
MQPPLPIYIGKDVIANLIQHCDGQKLGRFTLVADQNTYPILGKSVEAALRQHRFDVNTIVLAGREIIVRRVLHHAGPCPRDQRRARLSGCRLRHAHRHRTFCQPQNEIVIHFDSDSFFGKWSSSASSSLAIGRMKQTISAHSRIAIFADLPTLCAASRAMIAAGFGDMLGKFTALADWGLGHLCGTNPTTKELRNACETRYKVV